MSFIVAAKSASVSPGKPMMKSEDRDLRANAPQPADARLVLERRMSALHRCEDTIGAALHRQVQVVDQRRDIGVGLDQRVGKLHRVRRGVADAVDAGNRGHEMQQFGEIDDIALVVLPAIGVDVLAEQVDLAYAARREAGDLGDDVVEGAR
jgi:hypothetical protein